MDEELEYYEELDEELFAEEYLDEDLVEYCTELCYRSAMEEEGFCSGDDCVDWDCYKRCVKS